MRAHFRSPLLDDAGNRVAQATVRILQPGTTVQLADVLYASASTGATLGNPFQTGGNDIEFYLNTPQRVDIGVTVAGFPERFWRDVDVLASGMESLHPGGASQSVQVGNGAAATQLGTSAFGSNAVATAVDATAIGSGAQAMEQGTTAVGSAASATWATATAVGQGAIASSSSATAVGTDARAVFGHSTAVGANSATSRDFQVMLGTAADDVDIPGTLVLVDPTGQRWGVKVGPDGGLMACELEGLDSLNPGGPSGPGTIVLPLATTTAPGMVRLNGTDAVIQPLGTQAAGVSNYAADAAHVHSMPRMQDILSPTADVPWGSKRLTTLANGSAAQDAASTAQLGGGRNHPALFGLLGWSAAPSEVQQKYAAVSGQQLMFLARPVADGTVSKLGVYVGQVGATSTGVNGLALYSEAGVLLGQTGDASAAFATLGFQELSVGAPVQVSASSSYYLAVLSHMSTAPQIWAPTQAANAIPAVRGHKASVLISGQTTFQPTVDISAASLGTTLFCLSMGN